MSHRSTIRSTDFLRARSYITVTLYICNYFNIANNFFLNMKRMFVLNIYIYKHGSMATTTQTHSMRSKSVIMNMFLFVTLLTFTSLVTTMFGRRIDECLETKVSGCIFGSDTGHMLELAGSRNLFFRWEGSGLWSLGLFALAARNIQRYVGRIADQSFDGLPGLTGRLI